MSLFPKKSCPSSPISIDGEMATTTLLTARPPASIEAGGLAVNNVVVAISPSLDIGLLGQDFFGNKDITIKQDVIEFRSRS